VILPGEPPPEAKAVDWAWVVEMARKKIPAAKTYELTWVSPRRAGREEKAGDSPRCAFSVSPRRRKKRKAVPPAEKTAR
jgi:hypothetical protein